MNTVVALKKANKYTDLAQLGLTSITVNGLDIILTRTDGSQAVVNVPIPDVVSIENIELNESDELVITLTDGTAKNLGTIPVINGKDGVDGQNGKDGVDGYSPIIVENENNDNTTYKLDITDKNGTFTTPNLMGQGGNGGSGDENAIESISVNGKEIKPDENKNVDIAIPTISSEADNQIETKEDGIYVKDMYAKISAEEGNAITSKNDGLYVPTTAETKVSQAENNIIETKEDGIYVAPTDLSKYAKTEDISIDRDLTMAEYEALSEEEKMADVNYFVTDAEINSDGNVIVSGLSEDDVKTLLDTYGLEDENTLSTKANKQYEILDGCILKNTIKTIDTDYVFDVSIYSHKEIPSILETELYDFFESCANNPLLREEGSEYIDVNEILKRGIQFNAAIKLEQYSEDFNYYIPLLITVDNPVYGKENGFLDDDAKLLYVEYTLYGNKYSLMYIYEVGDFKLKGAISSGNAEANPIFNYSYSDGRATTKPMVVMDMSLTEENYAEEIGKSLMRNWHEWSKEILTFYNTPSDDDFLRDMEKFYLGLIYYPNSSSEKDILQYRVLEFNRIFIETSRDYSSQYNAKYLIKLDETTSYILEIEEAMDFSDLNINDDSYDYNKATLKMCVTTPTITDITL